MSVILIDRRSAALLTEQVAERVAASVSGAVPLRPGVSKAMAPPVAAPRTAARRAATRPARRPSTVSVPRDEVVTVRRGRDAQVRLSSRFRCEPSRVGVAPSRRRAAVAAARRARRVGVRRRSLHLTPRGRLVALVLFLVVLSAAFSVGRVTSTALGAPGSAPAEVVVQRGDTLWSIAGRVDPGADPREVAAELMVANGLATPALEVGQHLRLP